MVDIENIVTWKMPDTKDHLLYDFHLNEMSRQRRYLQKLPEAGEGADRE